MDPNDNTSTEPVDPAAPATTATATAPAARVTFSPEQQEQVNAIVQKRLDEDRKRRTQATPVAAAPATVSPAPIPVDDGERQPTPKQLRDELNELKLRSRFDKLALKRGIEGDAAEDLYELFKAQKPTNDSEWFEAKSQRFGFKPGSSAAPTAPTATASPTAVPTATDAPKAAPAAPVAPSTHALPTANGVVDLFSLTHAQLQNLGPQGVRENLEKLWAIGNQMSGKPQRPKVPTR